MPEYHGSGCTLASAIAARILVENNIETAIKKALDFTWKSLHAAEVSESGQFSHSQANLINSLKFVNKANIMKGLYAITDYEISDNEILLRKTEQILKAGATILQYREKKSYKHRKIESGIETKNIMPAI